MGDRLDAAVAELVAALREELVVKAPRERVELLTVAEACRWTGLSRTAMMGAISRGEVRSWKIGGRRVIPADAITDPGSHR